MPGFKRTIVIKASPERVFDFMTDLKNVSLYMPNVTAVELLTEGGLRPGAKFRETRVMRGKEQSAVIEVLEHQRPHVHAARSAMLGMNAAYWFRFTPDGTGTRVDLEAVVKGNLLWWPFLGMISKVMEKEDGELLERVKAAIEGAAS